MIKQDCNMKDFKPKTFKDDQKKATVFLGLCKGCGLCIENCPQKGIIFSKKDVGVYSTPSVEFDLKRCQNCKICENICPDCAIKIEKK